MKLLVTGASGFIGRNLLLGLPSSWSVTATFYHDDTFDDFLKTSSLLNVTSLRIDLSDANAVKDLPSRLKQFDACVFLAANGDPGYSVKNPAKDLRDNVATLINVLMEMTIGHIVYFSSGAVYDGLYGDVNPDTKVCPLLPYAISKWAAERYIFHARRSQNIAQASVIRFFGAFGPYEPPRKIFGRLIRSFAFERNPRFTIRGNGKNLIDAMYIEDTVRAVITILLGCQESIIVDLYSGAPLSITDLVNRTAAVFGLEADIAYTDDVPEYIEFRSNDRYVHDVLGFVPTVTLEDGLDRFRKWMVGNEKWLRNSEQVG